MNPELQQTLAALANKLGTSVERLWPLLVRQEFTEHLIWLIFCATVLVVSSTFLTRALWSLRDLKDIMKKPYMQRSLSEDKALEGKREWVCALFVLALISFAGMLATIPGLVVPEASVVHTLLGR